MIVRKVSHVREHAWGHRGIEGGVVNALYIHKVEDLSSSRLSDNGVSEAQLTLYWILSD